MSKDASKNDLESPALPNNFSGKSPLQDMAPKIGGGSFGSEGASSKDRGKDGTAK